MNALPVVVSIQTVQPPIQHKMPPQIKQDLNRSGWETTDMPSVCERCLPENPMVQMLKEDYGAECKVSPIEVHAALRNIK